MKFLLTQLAQIKEAQALGVLDGVTTNRLWWLRRESQVKNNILKHYVDICNPVEGMLVLK
jgi:transaldolase